MASIVDWMKRNGQDSSYAARKKLAAQRGINDYRGTAKQNIDLLRQLRNGNSGPTKTTNTKTSNIVANKYEPSTQGPGISLSYKASGSTGPIRGYTPSDRVNSAYSTMQAKRGERPDPYEESDYVQEYRDRLRDVEGEKPDPFKSKYSDQIDALIDGIYGDKGFKYTADDLKKDDLYKMYEQAYTKNADKAMRDTVGNMTALSGGYGSSFAGAVGQQQYDENMSHLNDRVFDFYDRAFEKYRDNRNDRYNKLGVINNQDNIDYGRYRDTVGDWKDDRNYYLNALDAERAHDLNTYNTNAGQYWNDLNFLAGRYDKEYDNDFGAYTHDESKNQWQEEFKLKKDAADLDKRMKEIQIQKMQQDMALKAAKGSGGRRRSGGRKKKKKNSEKERMPYEYIESKYIDDVKEYGTKEADELKKARQEYFDVDYRKHSTGIPMPR